MLTAFTARPIVELKARDKSKIESLVAYGDRLLVGLNTGVLRIYRVNDVEPADGSSAAEPENGGQPKRDEPTHLLREVEKFAPRSIDQLAIIKEANTLVSLANYAVSLHDLQSFAPLPGAAPLPGTKNAACFAVTSNIVKDPATGIPEIVSRLAVAVKRRLLLWSWYASELSGGGSNGGRNGGGGTSDGQAAADGNTGGDGRASMAPSEITLSETIRSLTWASATKLVVGMNAGYVLVDVLTRVVDEIEGGAVAGANGSNGEGASSRFGALGSASMGYMGLGSYMPKPLAAKLADGEVLLAKDVHTLFITDTGKPLDRRGIPWPAAPESVGYSYPYILALQPPAKGSLEVRNPKTLSLLQTIAVPSAMQLHVPPPSVSLAHAGKGFHVSSERGIWKMDATAYDDQVATLVGHGHLDEAISLLGMLEDALLRNKTETLRSIKMQKADMLFRKKRYLEAMDLFNEEDVHAPPERVFRFFPRSIVGDLSDEVVAAPAPIPDQDNEQSSKAGAEAEGEEAGSKNGDVDESEEGGAADADAEASAATATNGKNGTTDGEPAPAAATPPQTQQAPEPTLLAGGFTKAFWGHRKLNSDAASIASGVAGADSETVSVKGKPAAAATTATTATAAAATAVATGAHDATTHANGYVPLEGKELVSAAEALNSYLAGTRARLQRVIDPATGKLKKKARGSNAGAGAGISQGGRRRSSMLDSDSESGVDDDMTREARLRATFTLVDTTMFRVLMLIRPKLASSLFRIPNFCDPNVVNERLLEHSRFNELVDFFYGKRLHRPALELLKRFGDVDRAAEKGEGEDEKTASTKGKDGNDASGSASIVPPALRGPRRTIVYLQSLPPEMIDLILEFAGWTLRADPVHSMDVFLADSENAETLPRDRVVRFLAGIDPLLEMRYLEHIIGELNDLTPDFHNRLIEQMIKLLKEGGEGPDGEKTQEDDDDVDKTKIKDWAPTMARLVAFLNDSRQYSLSRAFGLIPRDAVVLSNMGQHKQALEIYVYRMKDYAKAEEYCNRIHKAQEQARAAPAASANSGRARRTSTTRTITDDGMDDGAASTQDHPDKASSATGAATGAGPSSSAAPSIYHTLLSLYLTPPPPHERQLAPALDLLSRHGSRLPASSTMQLIPDGLPVAELLSYFRGRMRAANSVVNESRIEKGLRQTAMLEAQASLLLGSGGLGGFGGLGMGSAPPAGRNRRVVVSEERVCGVCHKRLGGSVVAALPDNTVVHYGCLNRAAAAARDGSRVPAWR